MALATVTVKRLDLRNLLQVRPIAYSQMGVI